MRTARLIAAFGVTLKRLGGLFVPRRAVPRDQALSAQLLNGLFLAAFPVFLLTMLVRLLLGIHLTETANLTLLALIILGLVGTFILRSGRVRLSGVVLTLSLWAAGTFIAWSYFGTRDTTAFIPLFAVLIAFVVLPWQFGLLLTGLNLCSIWLYVVRDLRTVHASNVARPLDAGLAFTEILILVSVLAFVFGRILGRAVRTSIATQQALSNSEKELSSILQTTPDIIYRLDTLGRITYVNDAVRRYGYDPSEMLGTELIDYVAPEDRERAMHCIAERRTGARSTKAFEIRLLTRRGDERTAEYTAVPTFREPVFLLDAEGLYESGAHPVPLYLGTQGIARDITDRKRATEALMKSEEKYSKVFRAAPAGFVVVTLDGERILDVNEEFERIGGYGRDELLKFSGSELGLWVDPADRQRLIDLVRGGSVARHVEIQGRRKTGEVRIARCKAQQLEIGGIPCVLVAVEDVTDQRRLEAQLYQARKLEAIGRLAGGIAHDFNNMLTVIAGHAEIAASEVELSGPVHENIVGIREAARRSAELTRQLLLFARGKAGQPSVLNLNDAISDRLGMLKRLAGDNVTLKWSPAPDLWPVKMDPVHVDQILVNLVANARDAMADVGTLTISTENRFRESEKPSKLEDEGTHEWVLMTLADTGSAMTDETRAHIFEPFYTTKEFGKGTGMGLATVYGIIQQNTGRIEVESMPGKGTTFRIWIPRTHEIAVPAEETLQPRAVHGRETVLVVDDEPAVLQFVRTSLTQLGYTVIDAGSPEEALSLAGQLDGALHLLVSDLVMPRMSGRDLYARIVAFSPGTRVVFMTGYSPQGEAEIAGEDALLLRKPFSIHQLSTRIRKVLDQPRDATGHGAYPIQQGEGDET